MPQFVFGANRGGDWPGVWFAVLAANPGSCTEEPHWDSKTGGDIGNRHGGVAFAGTPCTVALGAGGEPWKSSCDMPAGTLDTDPLGVFGKP